jgi:hypothetical protein
MLTSADRWPGIPTIRRDRKTNPNRFLEVFRGTEEPEERLCLQRSRQSEHDASELPQNFDRSISELTERFPGGVRSLP